MTPTPLLDRIKPKEPTPLRKPEWIRRREANQLPVKDQTHVYDLGAWVPDGSERGA